MLVRNRTDNPLYTDPSLSLEMRVGFNRGQDRMGQDSYWGDRYRWLRVSIYVLR